MESLDFMLSKPFGLFILSQVHAFGDEYFTAYQQANALRYVRGKMNQIRARRWRATKCQTLNSEIFNMLPNLIKPSCESQGFKVCICIARRTPIYLRITNSTHSISSSIFLEESKKMLRTLHLDNFG